jgi:hypothetical protein
MLLTITSTSGFYSPYTLLGLEISTATAKMGGGLAFFTLAICYLLKVALFFIFILRVIYM